MVIALLLSAALAWWLHRRGELVPNLARLGGSAVLGLLALRMLETGKPLIAAGLAAGAAVWWWRGGAKSLEARDTADARALLGVAKDADAAVIQAAWRRKIAAAHPDRGGTTDKVAAVTAARDLLLARIGR